MRKPVIGITMGDPAGIGAEISVKALEDSELYEIATPVIIGAKTVIADALNFMKSDLKINIINKPEQAAGEFGKIDLLDLDNIEITDFNYGEISAIAGKAAIEYIFKGIDLAIAGRLAAVVTGPIHKEAINAAGFKYAGHTEIFAEKTNTSDYAMMLTSDEMMVIHVSTHVSLREACDRVTIERVYKVIKLADQVLKKMGIESPKIAVAGLNPHAGEQGLFGYEEINEIIPAIKQADQEGILVDGPIPPDTVFSKVRGGLYDIAVAMYHDQGHIPMKVTAFKYDRQKNQWSSVSGVNTTIGLPIIRTSVDHGVAFDRAGQGTANKESMVEAIKLAVQLAK